MSVADSITKKLKDKFNPASLEVIDESHLHQGHAGHNGKGESHFRIKIMSASFDDMSRVDIHRAINETLAEELAGPVHALAIKAEKTG